MANGVAPSMVSPVAESMISCRLDVVLRTSFSLWSECGPTWRSCETKPQMSPNSRRLRDALRDAAADAGGAAADERHLEGRPQPSFAWRDQRQRALGALRR